VELIFFGSYDARQHPRVEALISGFQACGDTVTECNEPLGLSTARRVELLRHPWKGIAFLLHLVSIWRRLWRTARDLPKPDAVVVGYLGHFDVHLARRIWPETPIALDYMISGADTASDRVVGGRAIRRVLTGIDRAAIRASDLPFVDTEENLSLIPAETRSRAAVALIGAPDVWFRSPEPRMSDELRVVFFGLFTPLQGAETIGRAIGELTGAPIHFTMAGRGQDYEPTRRYASGNPNVSWVDWVEAEELPGLVQAADVCLGIFGTTSKALRVVPNKVYQGAAAGCAVITSDTDPQRRVLASGGLYVPPGDPAALATALLALAESPDAVWSARRAAYQRAEATFTPEAVTRPLRERLQALASF
jgi:glycosyltransferase involved in cell wall biosynthesis